MHGQLMPSADLEIGLPERAVATQVAGTVFYERPAAFFGFNPPGHHVVVSWRRTALPIEEVVPILGRLGHIQVEGHVSIRAFFYCYPRTADLHSQLLRVEDVVRMDREFARIFAFLH